MHSLSSIEARRIALAAQGFGAARPAKPPGVAHLRALANRLHAIQIDSVNVLVRAHYMPAFSRLGPYRIDALDDLTYRRRELFEYMGHAASLLPMSLFPLLHWRMGIYKRWPRSREEDKYMKAVLAEIAMRGPISASELKDPGSSSGSWWGWSKGKLALEWLFRSGQLAIAGRRGFERLYDLTERVISKEVLESPEISEDDAKRALLMIAAKALGVGTRKDIVNYFYLDSSWERPSVNGKRTPSQLGKIIDELAAEGRLAPVKVEGWKEPAFLHPSINSAKPIEARALISPFDPLVWERDRTLRLFGFNYRIEIYVPAPKRQYGYYVLPFLLGDRMVARIDLKADRKARSLRVLGAFEEPEIRKVDVVEGLASELTSVAAWLKLERVEVARNGTLATALSKALR